MTVTIRPEIPADRVAIYTLTQRAFAPMPYAGGNEQDLIDQLRDAGALSLSLVAEQRPADGGAAVIGQITLSPAVPADGSAGWYALGPVAVTPEHQSVGIGGQLIRAAIDWLRAQDAAGCVLVGNPAYYSRFGFRPYPVLCPEGEPADFYQILPLAVAEPETVVGFHPLFHGA